MMWMFFPHEKYYNKYLIYALIDNFIDWKYDSISRFCDNFIMVYREIDKNQLTPLESVGFDKIDTAVQLYSPYQTDHEKYSLYTSENDIYKCVRDERNNLTKQ